MKALGYGFGFGSALVLGGGLIYAVWWYPFVGVVMLLGLMFLIGGIFIGGVILLVNAQWAKAVGRWMPRTSHNIRYDGGAYTDRFQNKRRGNGKRDISAGW